MPRANQSKAKTQVVKEQSVPGGKIVTRKDGAEKFIPAASNAVPTITYRKTGTHPNTQGKIR